jgi:hypothetical protein
MLDSATKIFLAIVIVPSLAQRVACHAPAYMNPSAGSMPAQKTPFLLL